MDGSKTICLKWYFGLATQGGKKTKGQGGEGRGGGMTNYFNKKDHDFL
jgi:hypothetical protein